MEVSKAKEAFTLIGSLRTWEAAAIKIEEYRQRKGFMQAGISYLVENTVNAHAAAVALGLDEVAYHLSQGLEELELLAIPKVISATKAQIKEL